MKNSIEGIPDQPCADGSLPVLTASTEPSCPWLAEPSEKEWVDPETGYQCLAMRNGSGAWCGYVAVPADHPAHGLSYYRDSYDIEELLGKQINQAAMEAQQAVNEIRVHGGLTFSGSRPNSTLAPDAHWFGFDCSHAGDYSPNYNRLHDPVLGLGKPTGWGGVITYRTLEYVVGECASLAKQLALVGSAEGVAAGQLRDEP